MTHEYKTNDSRITIRKRTGAIYLVLLLVMSGVFIFLATAIMSLAFANLRLARHNESMVSSLSVAEAGVNYYLWHLAHSPLDYCDGFAKGSLNCPAIPRPYGYGPFTHDFTGPDGTKLGIFKITIKPPKTGSAIYNIKSVGTATNATVSRTITADIGIQSFAAYALVSNSNFWVNKSDATDGPVHSNDYMRYDYPDANDVISSSMENGVFTTESDVDKSNWQFHVPRVEFSKISNALTGIGGLKEKSQTNGIYLPSDSYLHVTNQLGYYLKLKSDNTIDMAIVTAEDSDGITIAPNPATNFQLPANFNGILYSEKPIWIKGTWNSRITIATAATYRIYDTRTSITIVNNLTYVSPKEDGTKKIGLVGTGDIRVPPYEPAEDMEIDAVMASQAGSVSYPLTNYLKYKVKNSITIYGSISSYKRWDWTWIDRNKDPDIVHGFKNSYQIYDRHLTIDPPPSFPTTGSFQVLTWREE